MNRLALAMIVKDAARFLPECLDSVRGVAEELVVADTGSTDSTVEIAQSSGARVIRIPWRNDFAEARNRCLDEVRSPWVLSLDADEVLEPGAGPAIARALAAPCASGYQVTIRNFVLSLQDRIWDRPALPNESNLPSGKKYPAYVDHQNVRLFRNSREIRFVGRVHESVGPTLVRQALPIAPAGFLIYHFGLAVAAEERAAKNLFYRELGRQKLREMPEDAQAHLELGIVEMDNFANLEEALALFSRARSLNPRLGPAWFFEGLVLLRKERYPEALRCLDKAESLGHRTSLVAETQGDAHYNRGAYEAAAARYRTALAREPESPWLVSKLGLARVRCGDAAGGLAELDRAIEKRPDAPELHDRKMLAQLALGNLAEAAATLEVKIMRVPAPTASDFLRAASLSSKSGNGPRASRLVDEGLLRFPADKNLLMARGELHNHLAVQSVLTILGSS